MLAAAPGPARTDDIPPALRTPPDELLTTQSRAKGVQIYRCRTNADAAHYEWVFEAPQAVLFDLTGGRLGKHYAGPTWEANDGSKVVGELAARVDSPSGTALPWLLLHAKSTSGSGQFGAVISIQRLHTEGGLAPNSGCTPSKAGREARVPYRADYFFYVSSR